MEKMIESKTSNAKRSLCAVPGCDGKLMRTEPAGEDVVLPCECDFKICKDCFNDAVETGGGICPGCKEPYNASDMDELAAAPPDNKSPPPPSFGKSKKKKKKKKISTPMKKSSSTGDVEFSTLFETKGTYGYGNAIWPNDGNGPDGEPSELLNKQWRPLTRKVKISAAVLGAYR